MLRSILSLPVALLARAEDPVHTSTREVSRAVLTMVASEAGAAPPVRPHE